MPKWVPEALVWLTPARCPSGQDPGPGQGGGPAHSMRPDEMEGVEGSTWHKACTCGKGLGDPPLGAGDPCEAHLQEADPLGLP